MDLGTLRRIIQQESPVRLEVGTVTSADPRGTRTVTVRLSGGHVCSRVKTCVDGLQVGDQVLVARMMQLQQVVVIGQLLGDVNPVLARQGVLAPPNNLAVTPVPAAIVVRWDTYPGEDICWEVRYNTSASDTGATDILVTRGSYYLHYIVDASGDMAAAATYFFKVRALRWLGDNNVMYSAWSAWDSATSGGHNLRDIVELELASQTELTISSGHVTRTQVYHSIDTEGDAGSDDLTHIDGAVEGDIIVIRPASDTRTVTLKHGTGNVWLLGKADLVLDDLLDHVLLIYSVSGWWCDVGGGAGGGGGGSSTFLGLTDTPGDYSGHKRELLAVTDAEAALNFIKAAGWLSTGDHSVGDASDIRWQPDCVAVLRGGVITEHADPDNAFVAADTAGDVILVPPGTWTLSAGHVLPANVSVYGLGPVSDCILTGTPAGSLLQLSEGEGEISSLTIEYTNTTGGAGTVVGLVLNAGNYAHHLRVHAVNEDTAALAGCDAIQVATGSTTTRLQDIWAHGETYGENLATGIALMDHALIERCYAWGQGHVANKYAAGFYAGYNAEIRWSYGWGYNAAGSTNAHGLYCHGNTYFEHSTAVGGTNDIKVDDGTCYIYEVQYDSRSGNVSWLAGDRAGVWRDEVIMGQWEFNLPVKLEEQFGHPLIPGPGAGHVYLYAKDEGGNSWVWYVDDNANPWRLPAVASSKNVTVGSGKDFSTIGAAVAFFQNRIVSGTCQISCDAGTYAEKVVFSNIVAASGATLTLIGDTRALAGMTFVDGFSHNRYGPAAGGSGTCSLSNAGNNITVACSTTNPAIEGDGWASGDRVLVKNNAGSMTIYTIDSVAANVITLTVAAPAVGNNGTAVALIPNRSIEPTSAGTVLSVEGVQGVQIRGFYLETYTGSGCNGLQVSVGGRCSYQNLLIQAEDYGLYATGAGSQIQYQAYHTSSVWINNTAGYGLISTGLAYAAVSGTTFVGPGYGGTNYGIYTQHQGAAWCTAVDVTGFKYGAYCTWQSEGFMAYTQAKFNDYGFYSAANSMAACTATMPPLANNTTADYTPNPGGAGQYAEDATTFGVLFKS